MILHLVPRVLLYVEAVALHGSVQGASRAISISASAIDRQILAFEEAAQTQLFERLPRGMRLTRAGTEVILLARRWQAETDRLGTKFSELHGQALGTVRMVAMDSLVNGILPDLVAQLSKDHPRILLKIDIGTPSEAAQALESDTTDLIIAFNLKSGQDQQRIWTEKLPFGCVVAPGHQLANEKEATLKQVSGHQIALQSRLLPVREYLERHYSWIFKDNQPPLVTNSLQLLKQVLMDGRLVLITSELDVLPELETGKLVFIPLRDKKFQPQQISIAINARRPLSKVARVVANILVTTTKKRLGDVQTMRELSGNGGM